MKRRVFLVLGILLLVLLSGAAQAAESPKPPQAGAHERIWPDETIYFIMIDRFNNGDKSNDLGANPDDIRDWHGGDLQGVIDKLDYIKSLGFTAIWITPHVKNTARDYHGYGAVDYFATDPHFGTVAKTVELVQKAHAKGLKVLFDMVVNHAGTRSPLLDEKPDWFHPRTAITDWNDPRQLQDGWLFNLPDFDQSKAEVREYILSYSRFWIEQTGVDGFRLDTVRHVPPEFFKWYSAELQKVKPGFWLIGEVWESSPYKLAIYQDAGVTALMDFPLADAMRRVFAKDGPMTNLASVPAAADRGMTDPWELGGFLDNHDMARFTSEARDDQVRRLKLGLTYLFTQRSIPILYYGTEIAMEGKNDPYNRVDFPWGKEENLDVRDLTTRLNALRHEHVALRRGTVQGLMSDQWQYAFARVAGDDRVVVVLNNHATERFAGEVEVAGAGIREGEHLRDVLTGKEVKVSGGKIRSEVGARSAAIYVKASSPWPAVLGVGAAAGVLVLVGVAIFLRRRRS